jgi:hypothetical protein
MWEVRVLLGYLIQKNTLSTLAVKVILAVKMLLDLLI